MALNFVDMVLIFFDKVLNFFDIVPIFFNNTVLCPQDEVKGDLQKALISASTDISWYWSSQEKYLQSTNLANKDLLNREIKFDLIVPSIERVVKDMKYDWLTVEKIAEKVNANKFLNERISNYTVRKVLKQNMNYSYKKLDFVLRRPLV